MPIWKQRLLSRLHRPADGEGNDLGGTSATEAAIDAIGVTETPTDDTPPDTGSQAEDEGQPTGDQPASDQPAGEAPRNKLASMLDALTDDPNAPKKADEKPADPKPEDPAAAKPEDKPAELKTPEQEVAELLDGVKSERGKERIRKVFEEKKALETDLQQFRQIVQSTGMDAQQFGSMLEFGRLANSQNPADLNVALQMIEQQRTELYARLGKEAPGVDLLAGHADLQQAVENMEITRERAVELAKFRKQEREQAQRQQTQQQSEQEARTYQETVQKAAGQMEAYLATRANEIDHAPRMQSIISHFKNPANLQKFVETFKPEQWTAALQMMYDGVQVPRQAPSSSTQPLRSRPAQLGRPAPAGATPIDRVASAIDSMGI